MSDPVRDTGLPGVEEEVLDLLRDAAVLRLAAAAFAYPDPRTRDSVRRSFDDAASAQAARLPRLPWSTDFARARTGWNAGGVELESEYVRLFLGAAPCPLHETAYGDGRRAGGRVVELADVAGFYRAFGFAVSPARPDLPDHLSAELEFAGALLVKEAYALAEGTVEAHEVTRAAAAEFLAVHLGRWPAAFRRGLAEEGADPAYLALADFAVSLVTAQCSRLDVKPLLAEGRLDVPEEDCVSCPMASVDPAP